MKKILRYLMGLGGKAPTPPPKKRTVAAHEFALKQVDARRRSEKAKEESAGVASATSEAPVVMEQAMPAGDGVTGNGAQAAQAPLPGKRRKARKARHQLSGSEGVQPESSVERQPVEVGVDAGTAHGKRDPAHQLSAVAVNSGVKRVKHKMKHRQAEAGVDAKMERKKRRREQQQSVVSTKR